MDAISPISAIPSSYTRKQIVTNVYDTGYDGQHKVVQDVYLTTVYDAQGKINTVTTAHRVDYLV
tara:strand:- start:784 stop:975 length:192 start_codon:yes stop_codon:yes gene_type:complete